jgi:triacylglycerol lipase
VSRKQPPYDAGAPQVYLVPGLLGFQRLDALRYFDDEVVATLRSALRAESGAAALVRCAETEATASIARRAARLLAFVAGELHRTTGPLYFVGHSTGGLDARLLLSPSADVDFRSLVREGWGEKALAATLAEVRRRTRGVVSLATPHYGAPLASQALLFNVHLLAVPLAFLATAEPVRWAALETVGQTVRLAAHSWAGGRVRDWIDAAVAFLGRDGELDPGVFDYLAQIARDQGALFQLTPQGTNLFNASVEDAPGLSYASVVTVTPPPSTVRADPSFHALHWLTSRAERGYDYPPLEADVAAHLEKTLGFAITAGANDGIVPTLGQVHGRLAAVAVADHLDVVGMFPRNCEGEREPGWLESGAGFRAAELAETWRWIARALVRPAALPALPHVIQTRPAAPQSKGKKKAA